MSTPGSPRLVVCGPDYRVGNRLSGQERTLRPDQFSKPAPPGPQLPAGQGGTQTPPSLFSSWNLTLWMASGRASSRVSSSASSSVSGRASG